MAAQSSSKITDWQIEVKVPLKKWRVETYLTGTWDEAIQKAAQILDSEEGEEIGHPLEGIYQVRVCKMLMPHTGYTYLPSGPYEEHPLQIILGWLVVILCMVANV